MKNKGNFKRASSNLTKRKERGEGKGKVRKDMFVACLSKTLRKKDIDSFPVASVQDIMENSMYLMTEGAEA